MFSYLLFESFQVSIAAPTDVTIAIKAPMTGNFDNTVIKPLPIIGIAPLIAVPIPGNSVAANLPAAIAPNISTTVVNPLLTICSI